MINNALKTSFFINFFGRFCVIMLKNEKMAHGKEKVWKTMWIMSKTCQKDKK